ncbi:unnamed protein product, partial [Allacma fusca]
HVMAFNYITVKSEDGLIFFMSEAEIKMMPKLAEVVAADAPEKRLIQRSLATIPPVKDLWTNLPSSCSENKTRCLIGCKRIHRNMTILNFVVVALTYSVASRMPSGYVMLSVTHKTNINEAFQLVCSHLDCYGETCQSLSIFKDSNPFLRKDYETQDILIYPLAGSPFRLMQFRFLNTRVIVEGKIANEHASGNFTCQMTGHSGTDTDWGEMSLFPCKNCTFEAVIPNITFNPQPFSQGMNRTVGADFEVSCNHISCNDNDCIYLNILKDDQPFLRTEFGLENVNIYPLEGNPFGRIKLQKYENVTKVVVQVRNYRAGGKYSCEFVSLGGQFKDSSYLNVIAPEYDLDTSFVHNQAETRRCYSNIYRVSQVDRELIDVLSGNYDSENVDPDLNMLEEWNFITENSKGDNVFLTSCEQLRVEEKINNAHESDIAWEQLVGEIFLPISNNNNSQLGQGQRRSKSQDMTTEVLERVFQCTKSINSLTPIIPSLILEDIELTPESLTKRHFGQRKTSSSIPEYLTSTNTSSDEIVLALPGVPDVNFKYVP